MLSLDQARDIVHMAEIQGLSTGALQAEIGARENAKPLDTSLELGAMRLALVVLRRAIATIERGA